MTLAAYFDSRVLVSAQPEPLVSGFEAFLVVFGVILILGLVLRIVVFAMHFKNPPTRQLLHRFAIWGVGLGVLGVLHTVAQQAAVAFLGARLVIIVIVAAYLIWLVWLIYAAFTRYPVEMAQFTAQARRAQYIPRKRK